jgi:hypothetical protein
MIEPPRNERRQHARHRAHVIMEIRGHVDGPRIAEMRGVTVDVGCGGALAVFKDDVPADPDLPFMVRFVDADGKVIAPGLRWGSVLRSDRVSTDSFAAVKFQQPLPPTVLGELLGADLAPAALSAEDQLHRGHPRVSDLLGKAHSRGLQSTQEAI